MEANHGIDQILAQIRTLRQESRGRVPELVPEGAAAKTEFSQLLAEAIDTVNELQQEAGRATEAFQRGEPGVDLASVMVATQKASIAFDAMVQVRNRLISAYQDVLNMPV